MPKNEVKEVKQDSFNLKNLESSLNKIANCLGYLIVHNISSNSDSSEKNKKEVPVLSLLSMGFTRKEIASITNITVEAQEMILQSLEVEISPLREPRQHN